MLEGRRGGCVVAVLTGALTAAVPSGALAQTAAPPAPTLTALGSAQVKPVPADRQDDASIRRAVAAASAKAMPQAVAAARARATDLATAAGVSLGALVAIADTPPPSSPFLYSPQNGTFGNGRFCGQVRNFRTVVRPNGARRRVALKGTHKVCRVPSTVSVNVSLTYTLAA